MAQHDDLWESMTPVLEDTGPFVLATIVATSASAPRPTGTQMAVLGDGTVLGSLSGGCIEADVVAHAEDLAVTGGSRLQDYGYSDATAFGIGLTCGGSIRVLLERIDNQDLDFFRHLSGLIRAGRPVVSITVMNGPDAGNRTLMTPDDRDRTPEAGAHHNDHHQLAGLCRKMLREQRSGIVTVGPTDYFLRGFGGPDHLIVFGSNAFAAALVRLASTVGYRVTLCDARPTFTTRERFPEADQIVVRQPHRYLEEIEVDDRTVLCAMTHDPKFDDPLLAAALRSPAGFIGAMGSRHTSEERRGRLSRLGFDEEDLARLHAPFGLDLQATSPEETAVSMLAEIISARRGGSNRPLSVIDGRIHRPDQPVVGSNAPG